MSQKALERFARTLLILDKIVTPFDFFKYFFSNIEGKNHKVCFIKLYEKGALSMMANLLDESSYDEKNEIFLITLDSNADIAFLLPDSLKSNIYFISTKSFFEIIVSIFKIRAWASKNEIGKSIVFDLKSNIGNLIEVMVGAKLKFKLSHENSLRSVKYQKNVHMMDMYNSLCELVIGKVKGSNKNIVFKNLDKENVIGLYINTHDPLWHRTWPMESWYKLIDELKKTYGVNYQIKLFTTYGSDELIDFEYKKYVVMTSSINELVKQIQRLKLFITTDCGPSHFSSFTNTKVLTLFGPESPKVFSSQNPLAYSIYKNESCSPCFNQYNKCISSCKDNVCMKKISVQDVIEAVQTYLLVSENATA